MSILKSVGILGLGKALPQKRVTNNDLVLSGLDTSDEWIFSRTGIRERRVCDPGVATSDLATQACKEALTHWGGSIRAVDLVLVATSTPDYPLFPSTACLVQHKLGLTHIGAFDLSAACSGFSYALTTAVQYVQTGQASHVLVAGADVLSRFINWKDRSICVLFGDGAGAALVGPVKQGYGILYSKLYSAGEHFDILKVQAGGSLNPITQAAIEAFENTIYMNGKAVFKVAVESVVPALELALSTAGLKASDIDLLVPHQANQRIVELIQHKLHLSDNQVFMNIDKYGNTSAASIPIALKEASEKGLLKEGCLVLTVGFGAGFTWAVNIIRFGGEK